jgi:hypothetical protein
MRDFEKVTYDKKDTFENDIRPLAERIREICKRERIPFFYTFAVSLESGATSYESIFASPEETEAHLTEDHIKEHIRIASGGAAAKREGDVFEFFADGEEIEFDFGVCK